MDIEARLAAIEEMQGRILCLLAKGAASPSGTMTLKEAAAYTGYSPDHFRRLAVEQRIISFSRPSGQQKGKLLFRKADLDTFLDSSKKGEKEIKQPGRKRKSKDIRLW
jgi:excisionase family DNA binding protein